MTDSSLSHPSIDVLADLCGDVRDDGETRAARAHLASCDSCTETYAVLADLPSQLAAMSAAPIPMDVALRIEAAIVRASDERAAPAAVAIHGARRRGAVARWVLGTAAVGAAAAVAGFVLVNGVPGGVSTTAQDGADSGSENSVGQPSSAPGSGRTGASTLVVPTTAPFASGTTLDAQVLALIEKAETRPSSTKVSGTDGSAPTDTDLGVFDQCVATVNASTGRAVEPLAAEETIYQGKAAVILVFGHRGDPDGSTSVDGYVLPESCLSITTQVTPTIASIIDSTTVRR